MIHSIKVSGWEKDNDWETERNGYINNINNSIKSLYWVLKQIVMIIQIIIPSISFFIILFSFKMRIWVLKIVNEKLSFENCWIEIQ